MTTPAIVLTITAVFIPIFFCGGFFYGFNTAQGVFCHHTAEKHNIPLWGLFHRKNHSRSALPAESSQRRRARILAENVENYGTDVPQKEVE